MKIDRLYAIMIYLLNHGKTSASELAQHFEVSIRTIQRDIDALCLAGIPIAASTGVSGGYELTDTFRMERHTATKDDYAYILTALRGLATATNNQKVSATLEKITSLTKTDVSIRCKAQAKSRVIECLNGKIITESENGDVLMILNVVENEHFWLRTLLSMGDDIEILAPTHIRQHVLRAAQNIVTLYNEL